MKLVLDLARTLFTRLAILLLAALAFVAVDAYRASEAGLQQALQRLERARDDLLKSKNDLVTQLESARHEMTAIEEKLEWWKAPRPPMSLIPGYIAWWAIERVGAINDLEKKRKELELRVARLTESVLRLEDRIGQVAEQKIAALTDAQIRGRWSDLFRLDFVRGSLHAHRLPLLLIALGLFLGPISVKAISFYGLAPLAKRASPITLSRTGAPVAPEPPALEYGQARKEVRIDVGATDSLVVKPGWYSLNTEGETRTRIFWDGGQPFASYAMGLVKMTEFAPDGSMPRQVRIGAEDDPTHDIVEIRLRDHPGYVVKHGHVVATSGRALRIEKRWRLWDWRSWLYGSLRYVYFRGTGSVYVHGHGRLSVNRPSAPEERIKERHVVGFDTRASFRMIRTETFVNYWLNDRPLYDIAFGGAGSFLQQQSFGRRDEKIFRSLLEDLLGAAGKFLGF